MINKLNYAYASKMLEMVMPHDAILIYACKYNIKNMAIKMIEKGNINCNEIDDDGNTALIYACKNKMKGVLKKLLRRNDINYNQANDEGYTALILACKNNI